MISEGDNCERNTKDHNIFSSHYTGRRENNSISETSFIL